MNYRSFYFARQWVKQGNDVTIVAAAFTHERLEVPSVIGDQAQEMIEGVRYIWLSTPAYRGTGIDRVRNMVAFLRRLARLEHNLSSQYCPNLVISASNYHFDSVSAHRIARKCGALFIKEIRD